MRFFAAGCILLSAATFAGPTPQPPDPAAAPGAAGDVGETWAQRVRKLPEIWPGGAYLMSDGRARIEYKHERVRQDGRELLRLTDRVTLRGAEGQEAAAVMTWLCEPDQHLTPVRFTAGKADEPPATDLRFAAGRVTGTKGGEKIDRPVPDRFVPHELLDRWVALMPFVRGARREIKTFSVLRLEEHTLEVICDGRAEMMVNDHEQPIWSIRAREPAAADPAETQRWYLFSDRRTLQKFVEGATPMSDWSPPRGRASRRLAFAIQQSTHRGRPREAVLSPFRLLGHGPRDYRTGERSAITFFRRPPPIPPFFGPITGPRSGNGWTPHGLNSIFWGPLTKETP